MENFACMTTQPDVLSARLAQHQVALLVVSASRLDDPRYDALFAAERTLSVQALTTRATTIGGLKARLQSLAELLGNEDVGDYVLDILNACVADAEALAGN